MTSLVVFNINKPVSLELYCYSGKLTKNSLELLKAEPAAGGEFVHALIHQTRAESVLLLPAAFQAAD